MTTTPPPTRITFCHYTADVQGGSDRSLYDLVTHLPRTRYHATMILRPDDPLVPRYRDAGISVHTMPFVPPRRALEAGRLLRFGLRLLPTVRGVARLVRTTQADVVHVNTMNNVQGALGARMAGRPLVWHVRELGRGALVDRVLLALVARLASRAVAVSRAVATTLGGCRSRVRLVANGIDLSEYADLPTRDAARRALGISARARVVAVIGRLEPWKGQDVAIEAFAAVADRVPEAMLLIVGGGATTKPGFGRALEGRVAALGLGDRVRFLGVRQDVPHVLAATDVLVAPTVSPEPFGRTLVEGMAAGVPVIGTAGGGPDDIIVPGESGWLVPPGSVAPLADAVTTALRDEGLARRLAEAGRRRATERYSLTRVVREMAEVFDEVTAERPVVLSREALVSST